ncbi:MAG: winged helix-turn-helix domain-containing protein, partial [Candidatus Limnocylindrales bacterium]
RVEQPAAAAAMATPKATTLTQNDLTIDTERYEVRRGDELVPLTPVEFKLLVTLVAADGRALTRDQLLDAVYGSDDGDVLDRTIDVHVGRLREKLGDDAERPLYVMTVRGVGYRAAPQVTEA